MILLLQLSLQAGSATCDLRHGPTDTNTSVTHMAHTSALSTAMDMTADMPVETHPPCSDMQGPLSCDGPWAPTTCGTMAVCNVAMTVSSSINESIGMVRPEVNFGAVPPLHDTATKAPLPPPPRA